VAFSANDVAVAPRIDPVQGTRGFGQTLQSDLQYVKRPSVNHLAVHRTFIPRIGDIANHLVSQEHPSKASVLPVNDVLRILDLCVSEPYVVESGVELGLTLSHPNDQVIASNLRIPTPTMQALAADVPSLPPNEESTESVGNPVVPKLLVLRFFSLQAKSSLELAPEIVHRTLERLDGRHQDLYFVRNRIVGPAQGKHQY
jgi:hypothetical protein